MGVGKGLDPPSPTRHALRGGMVEPMPTMPRVVRAFACLSLLCAVGALAACHETTLAERVVQLAQGYTADVGAIERDLATAKADLDAVTDLTEAAREILDHKYDSIATRLEDAESRRQRIAESPDVGALQALETELLDLHRAINLLRQMTILADAATRR